MVNDLLWSKNTERQAVQREFYSSEYQLGVAVKNDKLSVVMFLVEWENQEGSRVREVGWAALPWGKWLLVKGVYSNQVVKKEYWNMCEYSCLHQHKHFNTKKLTLVYLRRNCQKKKPPSLLNFKDCLWQTIVYLYTYQPHSYCLRPKPDTFLTIFSQKWNKAVR